jgi:hypothetical protein
MTRAGAICWRQTDRQNTGGVIARKPPLSSALQNTRYLYPWREPIATPPSGPLSLIEGLDKRIGLCNGSFHGANQGGNLRFHHHPLLPYGGNRPGIQVVFEKEHLIAEGGKDRRHRRFRALHRTHERCVALPGLSQLAGTRPPQALLRILR